MNLKACFRVWGVTLRWQMILVEFSDPVLCSFLTLGHCEVKRTALLFSDCKHVQPCRKTLGRQEGALSMGVRGHNGNHCVHIKTENDSSQTCGNCSSCRILPRPSSDPVRYQTSSTAPLVEAVDHGPEVQEAKSSSNICCVKTALLFHFGACLRCLVNKQQDCQKNSQDNFGWFNFSLNLQRHPGDVKPETRWELCV